jgi:hypothetical protein
VFFGLILFGALAAHQFNLEGFGAADVVRLPSDNPFAAYILGFLGNVLALRWVSREKAEANEGRADYVSVQQR